MWAEMAIIPQDISFETFLRHEVTGNLMERLDQPVGIMRGVATLGAGSKMKLSTWRWDCSGAHLVPTDLLDSNWANELFRAKVLFCSALNSLDCFLLGLHTSEINGIWFSVVWMKIKSINIYFFTVKSLMDSASITMIKKQIIPHFKTLVAI